jgi:uncharacterized membrane protein
MRHKDTRREPDATKSRYSNVLLTRFEILVLSFRIAEVLLSMAERTLLREFVRMKKTDVSLRVMFCTFMFIMLRACTELIMIADQTST